jgi:3-oxoadipate enol-lactonase
MPTVETRTARIHYEFAGDTNVQVLVLANSLGSSMRMWDKALPVLQQHYRVLRYDMRGHGQSSVPEPPYSMEQLGDDLLFLLDRLEIPCAHICGLSLGGMVAMWMGIYAPDRVRRLIFANTAARIGDRDGWQQRIAAVQSSGMEPLANASLERWFTPDYRLRHPGEMETMRAMIAATPAPGYAGCCAALRDADLRAQVAAIAAPCLVITGTHDLATPPADGRALYASLRQAHYDELDASHISAWEQHQQFAQAVDAFLQEEHRHG